jgi:hypothetical protein
MNGNMHNEIIEIGKIYSLIIVCFYLIFYDVIELMFCKVDWKTVLIHQQMFDLENMLRLSAKNAGIILTQVFVRQNVYENSLFILSFFQNFGLYVNEQMPFNCTKDLRLRLVHNDI